MKKNKKKKKSKEKRRVDSRTQPQRATTTTVRLDVADTHHRIQDSLTSGNARAALQLAKSLFAQEADAASEQLVVDAYAARVRELLAAGLVQEAEAVLGVALEKHAAHNADLSEVTYAVMAASRNYGDLLTNYDGLTETERAAVDAALRRWTTNPEAVASSRVLSKDHPLRVAAASVASAFAQVTQKPVPDSMLRLREVSRRSPFAPWVPLIRAIAAFYRKEDAQAMASVRAVPRDSAPFPIAEALIDLLAERCPTSDNKGAVALWQKVFARRAALTEVMAQTERALDNEQPKRALKLIRKLVTEVGRSAPSILVPLKQRLSIRCYWKKVAPESVIRAMDGPSMKDAAYWRLFAVSHDRMLRRTGESATVMQGCFAWNEFVFHAEVEGLLTNSSPAAAAVYLRMARNIAQLSLFALDDYRSILEDLEFRGDINTYRAYAKRQPVDLAERLLRDRTGEFILEPATLFDRAARIYPSKEIFSEWYTWALAALDDQKEEEVVLLAWHRRRPEDAEPLIHLGNRALNRGAFKKAMGFIQKARAHDPMNADLNRLHRKAVSMAALRHIKNGKAHLAAKDIDLLSRSADTAGGNQAAYLETLRALSAIAGGDTGTARRHVEASADLLGDPLAAWGLLRIVADNSGIAAKKLAPMRSSSVDNLSRGAHVEALARLVAICERAQIRIAIPADWSAPLTADLETDRSRYGAATLIAVAKAAHECGVDKLLFAVCNAGFLTDASHRARFLWYRGHSLPEECWGHAAVLFHAAACLARRQGDKTLSDNAMEDAVGTLESAAVYSYEEVALSKLKIDVPDEKIASLIDLEKHETTYPRSWYKDVLEERFREGWLDEEALCDCPTCRAARGEDVSPDEFEDDDYYNDDDDVFWEEDIDDDGMPRGAGMFDVPPAIAKLSKMLKQLTGLTPDAPPEAFERAAELLKDEFGELPPGVPDAALPAILHMLMQEDLGGFPSVFDKPARKGGRRWKR